MPDRALLVDTSAWIEALWPAGNALVRARVAALLADGRVVTTQMVVMELLSGARSEEEYNEFVRHSGLGGRDIDIAAGDSAGL